MTPNEENTMQSVADDGRLTEREKAHLRLECLRLIHDDGAATTEARLEHAAKLAAFVLNGAYTVTKKV